MCTTLTRLLGADHGVPLFGVAHTAAQDRLIPLFWSNPENPAPTNVFPMCKK